MTKYKKGSVVKATITAVCSYGAFAKIDDEYNGLIHVSELTDKFVKDITDYVNVGEVIDVEIIDIIEEKHQMKLSAKTVNDDLYKNKERKLKETLFGFYLLKSKLPKWINVKMKEINKER